ncbi:hypothetical protein G6M89_02430 [Natronolimnobius sp. AArcel1]|nr:hypothetical protein [Natronolimnobius sp. AArcel1]NGM67877.1 hypothetical protein [Natronolimnobius sp. AArcel1]
MSIEPAYATVYRLRVDTDDETRQHSGTTLPSWIGVGRQGPGWGLEGVQ